LQHGVKENRSGIRQGQTFGEPRKPRPFNPGTRYWFKVQPIRQAYPVIYEGPLSGYRWAVTLK